MTPRADNLAVLIVEDEKFAREDLHALVERLPRRGVIRSVANLSAAEAMWGETRVAFLDVKLAGETSFELFRNRPCDSGPAVIFVSAHKEYALEAFEVNAADFLLKPVEETRLQIAWRRALELVDSRLNAETATFPLPTSNGMEMTPVRTLISVHSEGNYVKLNLFARPPVILRSTFADWLANFPPGYLVETGRGHAVNRRLIVGVEGKNPRFVVLKDGSRHAISRRQTKPTESLLLGREG